MQKYEGKLSLKGAVISVDFIKRYEGFHVPLENEDVVTIKDKDGFIVVCGTYEKFKGNLEGQLAVRDPANNSQHAGDLSDAALMQIFEKNSGMTAMVMREKKSSIIDDYLNSKIAGPNISSHMREARAKLKAVSKLENA